MLYRDFLGFRLSELGIGTYLGNPDRETSEGYKKVLLKGLELGINVVDTAIVYRYMKSERDIGEVLATVGREKFFVSTKGGYLPYDIEAGVDPREYFYETFVRKGLIEEEDLTGHSLKVSFIDWCFHKSLENLRTSYIDVYFLHNPEEQLQYTDRDTFYKKIEECFEYLEHQRKAGKLRFYGLATWHGLRVPPHQRDYIDMSRILQIAHRVGGEDHGMRFVQLPYNLGMTEAFTLKNQFLNGREVSLLEFCKEAGIYVYTSASIFQGRVVGRVPQWLRDFFGVEKDVHAALQFVRSTPGVGTALVGMSKPHHLEENFKIFEREPVDTDRFLSLFERK
ncbi:aldo/keto reductase [Thermocrinis albus DSM 14484]|uniref:Aldo/keto reductase n=1 Tax=Thermocrinis albus (strain DSM 14484 / JCM 11386 / HI 11/12) TaxID=638303 RepID=D3SNS5_THEAH|nr:aldo/keto reductase [Thermocrinis albus]ADC88812.1 aldo/keto reductase [Thermocrinis albus DSM 14484]